MLFPDGDEFFSKMHYNWPAQFKKAHSLAKFSQAQTKIELLSTEPASKSV